MTPHEEGIEAAGRAFFTMYDKQPEVVRETWHKDVARMLAAYASKQPRVSDEEIHATYISAMDDASQTLPGVLAKYFRPLLDRAAWAGAAPDAKPLTWVNEFDTGSRYVAYESAENAERIAKECLNYGFGVKRVAVPVYEHPPAVNAANPMEAYNATRRGTAIRSWEVDSAGNITVLREDDTFWASHRGNTWAYITNAPTAEVPNDRS